MEEHADELRRFWPRFGPVWDALGVLDGLPDGRRGVVLVEAKSHPPGPVQRRLRRITPFSGTDRGGARPDEAVARRAGGHGLDRHALPVRESSGPPLFLPRGGARAPPGWSTCTSWATRALPRPRLIGKPRSPRQRTIWGWPGPRCRARCNACSLHLPRSNCPLNWSFCVQLGCTNSRTTVRLVAYHLLLATVIAATACVNCFVTGIIIARRTPLVSSIFYS